MQRIEIKTDRVDMHLSPVHLINLLFEEKGRLVRNSQIDHQEEPILQSITGRLKRTGMEMKLIVDGPNGNNERNKPDPSLVKPHRLKKTFIHNHGQTRGLRKLCLDAIKQYVTDDEIDAYDERIEKEREKVRLALPDALNSMIEAGGLNL